MLRILNKTTSKKLSKFVFSSQVPNLRFSTNSQKQISGNDEKFELPKMDWEDWIKQYPEDSREIGKKVINEYKLMEMECDYNSFDMPKIDWDYWKKKIKTPRAVDWIKAEFDSTDNSNYGEYYYDDLTDEARNEILKEHSEYAKEVEMIGRDIIKNGVRKTAEKELESKINSSKELTEKATLLLEQLYKDKEQLESYGKRFITSSKNELMAEFPSAAREIEESYVGNGFGTGYPLIQTQEHREFDMQNESPGYRNKTDAEMGMRKCEDMIDESIELYKKIGVEIDKENFLNNRFEKVDQFYKNLWHYLDKTRESNSNDGETGEPLFKEFDESFEEIRGGG